MKILVAALGVLVLAAVDSSDTGIIPKGDNSHWCCEVDITPVHKYVTKTRVKKFHEIVRTNITSGYEPCWTYERRFPELSSCPIYKSVTHMVPVYRVVTVTDTVVETPRCPDDKVICCKGFVLMRGNCVTKDQAELIQKLIDAGLIDKVGK